MPGFRGKSPRAFGTWLLVGLACLALVVTCCADITSNDTPYSNREVQANDVDEDVPLEELRDALIDDLLNDLAARALRMYGGRNLAGPGTQPFKRGSSGFAGAGRLTNLASGFHKRGPGDDAGSWDGYAEDKRGRGFFGNNQMTNLKSGFTKKSDDGEGDVKRGRSMFNNRLTNLASGFAKRDDDEEGDVKRGRSMFSNRLTNLASGFAKRDDDEEGPIGEDKRGRGAFSSRLTNLASGFHKRSVGDEGQWEDDSKDKRGRSSFAGASRLTNLSSGFKRDGNFNVGPMVHIPSGFTEKRADDADSL